MGETVSVVRPANYIWLVSLLAIVALIVELPEFKAAQSSCWTISKLQPGNTKEQASSLLGGQPLWTNKVPIDDDRHFDALTWDTATMYFVKGHSHSVYGKRLDYKGASFLEAGDREEELLLSLGQPDYVSETVQVSR